MEVKNMFCKYCGSEIADSSKFCDKCGKPVDTQASSQTIPVSSTTSANKPKKKHKKINEHLHISISFCNFAAV